MATQSPSPISTGAALKVEVGKSGDTKLDESQAVSPMRSARSVQPRVFARLQALFPPSISSPRSLSVQPGSPNTVTPPLLPPPSPQFIKTRIITWNMHDSLPKGDLEELLGSVPLHTPRPALDDTDKMRIPGLSTGEGHPYHIIVVAGQECPTLSGIPMGLGAIKYKDAKDREKDKERHKEKDHEKDQEKEKSKEKDLLHHTKSILSKHLKHDHPLHSRTPDSPQYDQTHDASSIHSSAPTSGWSTVLEDWFANGVGSLHDVKPVVTGTALDSSAVPVPTTHETNGDLHVNLKSSGSTSDYQLPQTLDVNWKPYNNTSTPVSESSPTSGLQAKTGPYELLVKERLMGIYTAVYIHRDVRSLVQGVSSGVVPAGLMGGRLGNKGGVGISLNLHGTTFLFINAHLAAHEGKVPLRVANLSKIKAELPVESFLSNDDPRTFAEDLTDRFDHTWIFGDLNFRLDISRLHADWLIARKEYAQAFEFDQLQKLMKDDEPALAGFREAKIDFPPTFKYDVLRTLKRDKHKSHTDQKIFRGGLDGVEERNGEAGVNEPGQEGEEDDEGQGEAASLRSSAWTSNHTRDRTDVTEDGDQSDPSPTNSPAVTPYSGPDSPTSKLMSHAALKAKAAWLALLKTSHDPMPSHPTKRRLMSAKKLGVPGSSIELSRGNRATPAASTSSLSPPVLRRVVSAKASLARQNEDDLLSTVDDKGIYDSSSKKRVPSWCDRILWKSTVEPPIDPEPQTDPEANPATTSPLSRGRGIRVSQLFQAFRPREKRSLNLPDSSISLSVLAHSDSTATKLVPSSTVAQSSHKAPVMTPPGLYQSKSLEPAPTLSINHALPSVGRKRSASATGAKDSSVPRRQSMPMALHSPRPLPSPRRAESDQPTLIAQPNLSASPTTSATPAIRAGPKRWFFNLVSRDYPASSPPSITPAAPQSYLPPVPQHRKGDVVCLSYRTLDDRQMRRLEGRSDHRPVIGSFAVHV